MTNSPFALTAEQVAELLGISRAHAYELMRTGEIPSVRLGRRVVVPRAVIDEMLGVSTLPEEDVTVLSAEDAKEAPTRASSCSCGAGSINRTFVVHELMN